MKAFIASDHAGFETKEKIIAFAKKNLDIEFKDLGTKKPERVDYPDFASKLSESLIDEPGHLGVLVCGSGQGMAMRANKYKHVRAALCWSEDSAKLSREHNDANVLCIGARLTQDEEIYKILTTFFSTDFEGGRHADRVAKITNSTK